MWLACRRHWMKVPLVAGRGFPAAKGLTERPRFQRAGRWLHRARVGAAGRVGKQRPLAEGACTGQATPDIFHKSLSLSAM